MRSTILTLIASLAMLAAPATAGETLREQSGRVLDAHGIAILRVENPRGLVRILPSTDGQIHLTALKIVRSTSREHAAEIARETQVTLATDGGGCDVRVRYPQRQAIHIGFWQMFSGFELPVVEVRITIAVPSTLPLVLRSASGDIQTEGLDAAQDMQTTSGDISVTDARGPLRAESTSGDLELSGMAAGVLRTVSGDVVASDVAGPIEVRTTSGDLAVRGASDSLVLRSVSGDIHVDRAPRGLSATTTSGGIQVRSGSGIVKIGASSGDVDLRLASPLNRADISTGSGDITVRLDPGLGCELELRTSNGALNIDLPLEVKIVTRHLVTGRVRQGTSPVVLRSSSGDIHLLAGGN